LVTANAPNGVPAFTTIIDGDLDGDLIPNFLDPDNDNDGTPDSADTDDDNDGILDMSDPDDDNDGIHDVCVNIDVNGDNKGDYNGLLNGEPTALDALPLLVASAMCRQQTWQQLLKTVQHSPSISWQTLPLVGQSPQSQSTGLDTATMLALKSPSVVETVERPSQLQASTV
jgi:hypothetical protein